MVILRKVEDNVAVDVPKICVHQLKNRGMNREAEGDTQLTVQVEE